MIFFDCGAIYCCKETTRVRTWLHVPFPAIKRKTVMPLKFMAFLLILITGTFGSARAQQISIAVQKAPLKQVLKEIGKQSGYRVMYNNKHLEESRPVTINIKNGNLKEALERCFEGQHLSYEIISKSIIIKPELQPGKEKPVGGPKHKISGKVTDETGKPLSNVSVTVKGTSLRIVTDEGGSFNIESEEGTAVLIFSYVGYETREQSITGPAPQVIALKEAIGQLADFGVISTGYQQLPKERATGSFEKIGNDLMNRGVNGNFLERIKNLSAGLLFSNDPFSSEPVIIRGRSTIFSDTDPLIVVDNFPYDGDIANLNPNDIESVTVLKDAAAASIWGTRAGNGVIVITTKRGTTGKPVVTFNNSVTLKQRPDVKGMRVINSSDYIDLEKYLFEKGNYLIEEDNDRNGYGHPPFTPVVELLRNARDGKISAAEANASIEAMKVYDARSDIEKYLYRNSIVRQHALSISGNSEKVNYYFSGGWDANPDNLVGRKTDRISLRTQEIFRLTPRLQVETGLNYVQNNAVEGENNGYRLTSGAGKGLYPYARLVDESGTPTTLIQNYNREFIRKAMVAGLLDWTYNPISDISTTGKNIKTTDILVNAAAKYNILPGLDFDLKYQYEHQQTDSRYLYGATSFFVRNLTNQFAQVNGSGQISYPIPLGGILNESNTDLTSHQGRAQLNFHKRFGTDHDVTAIGGWEIKNIRSATTGKQFYGYDKDASTINGQIDYKTQYPQYDNIYNLYNITNYDAAYGNLNRYLSYYANASYTYKDRYIISGSAREDASNLFGVKTNQKSVPLWSSGLAWVLDREPFYSISWLPSLKLRATYGFQGNVYPGASALVTATYDVSTNTQLPFGILKNPPNERLRWEKNGMLNLGIDFGLKGNILSGSIEYFQKTSRDLMGYAPYDPTAGIAVLIGQSNFFGNVAGMKSKGIDLTLNAKAVSGPFTWNTTYLLSHVSSNVTDYFVPVNAIGRSYTNYTSVNPIPGKPVYAVYSYRWAGLDPIGGNPQGYLDGKVSTDYASILSRTPLDSMTYHGPKDPTWFGAWRNTFSYKQFSLSFNISYKFGYYFRMPSVNYGTLFNTWTGSSDYALRWQKPGDEQNTNVPSLVYPANTNRDLFYANASVLVHKGDHIRLDDITLSYSLTKAVWKRLPFEQLRVYSYLSSLGLLWKANKVDVDPDFFNYPGPGKSFALGISLVF